MLTVIILFMLIIGVYSGYRNGIIRGLIQTIGYSISLILAIKYYEPFSRFIYLIIPYPSPFSPVENPYHYYKMDMIFTMDESYYVIVSFFFILLVGWLMTHFISRFLANYTDKLIVPSPFNAVGGALIGFLVNYLMLFLLLFILSTIPYDFIQGSLSESWLGDSMLTSTPFVSQKAYQHFIVEVHEEEQEKLPTMELEDLEVKPEAEEHSEEE